MIFEARGRAGKSPTFGQNITSMKRLLYALGVCLPLLGHAQTDAKFRDTAFYVNRYEVIEVRFRTPLLGSREAISDTGYTVYVRDALRVTIKNKKLTVQGFGTYDITDVSVKVKTDGSNGTEYWVTYKLRDGQQAILFGGYFMMDLSTRKIDRSYTFDVVVRPGRKM